MLYLPHLLTGAVIMKYSVNPGLGVPLALLSHFVLDMMPHNDFDIRPGITLSEFMKGEKKRRNMILAMLTMDLLLAGAAFIWIYLILGNIWLNLAGLAAVLPDTAEQTLMIFGIALPGWQDKLQWRVSARYGFIYYPVITFSALYFLLK